MFKVRRYDINLSILLSTFYVKMTLLLLRLYFILCVKKSDETFRFTTKYFTYHYIRNEWSRIIIQMSNIKMRALIIYLFRHFILQICKACNLSFSSLELIKMMTSRKITSYIIKVFDIILSRNMSLDYVVDMKDIYFIKLFTRWCLQNYECGWELTKDMSFIKVKAIWILDAFKILKIQFSLNMHRWKVSCSATKFLIY